MRRALWLVALAWPARLVAQGEVLGTVQHVSAPGWTMVYLTRSESLSAAGADTALLDQRDLAFHPRMTTVPPGTTVAFRNSDALRHNVFSPSGPGHGFNLGTYPQAVIAYHTFVAPGTYTILCHVHPDMLAYVVVTPAEFIALVDTSGTFRFSGVPPGRWVLQLWQRADTLSIPIVVPATGTLRVQLDADPPGRKRR
jgi:plastocyanin